MNADATPFVPGQNVTATPFVPKSSNNFGGGGDLSASAPPFVPSFGGAPRNNNNNNGYNNNTNNGYQQQQQNFFNPNYSNNNNNGYQQQQGFIPYNNNQQQQNNNNNGFVPQQQGFRGGRGGGNYNNNNNQYNNNNNNGGRGGGGGNNGGVPNNNFQQNQQQQQTTFSSPFYTPPQLQQQQQQQPQIQQQQQMQQQPQQLPRGRGGRGGYQQPFNNQNQQQQEQQGPVYTVPLSPEQLKTVLPVDHNRPLVFLFLGPRGSGKSTQSQLLAERLGVKVFSSGTVVTEENREPFVALGETLDKLVEESKQQQKSSPPGDSTMKAIVLDRCIANGTIDALYLLNLLHTRGLQLDQTIILSGDYLTAQERAEVRDKDNDKKRDVAFSRRMMEHSAIFEASENILTPYGGVVNIEVVAGETKEAVHGKIAALVDKYLIDTRQSNLKGIRTRAFPRLKLLKLVSSQNAVVGGGAVTMEPDPLIWLKLRDELQTFLGTPKHKFTQFPGSNVGAVLDQHNLHETVAPQANRYFVTYKADGIRVMLVRTQSHGTYLVTGKFMCKFGFEEVEKLIAACTNTTKTNNDDTSPSGETTKTTTSFDLEKFKKEKPNWYPLGLMSPSLVPKNTVKGADGRDGEIPHPFADVHHNITHIIDAELIQFSDKEIEKNPDLPPWRLYAFDCIVDRGNSVKDARFDFRYRAIMDFWKSVEQFEGANTFDNTKEIKRRFVTKPFFQANQLKQLLESRPEFPIDGLLFQRPNKYVVPRDSLNFKWKIPSQCTIDFRLSNGWLDQSRKVWMFIPCVLGHSDPSQPTKMDEIPFERAVIEIPDEKIGNFCDGSIAECVQCREPAKYQAAGAAFGNNSNRLIAGKQQGKKDPFMENVLPTHPLNELLTPLCPSVRRKVPDFFMEFWRTRGGGLRGSADKFTEVDVSLWEVIRDRSGDKPHPNLEEVALNTAHMKHVSLEDLVNTVCSSGNNRR